jgi:hypothetical protein
MKVYDADQVSLVIAENLIESGYADGEFVRIEQESDDFTDYVGTDGEVTRSKTNDRRATITVILAQTSAGNSLLSSMSNLDRNAPNGAGVGSFLLRDRQGNTVYSAEHCWVAKPPNATFDRAATTREWKLRCDKLERFDGGT